MSRRFDMTCRSCSREIEESSQFCRFCGAPAQSTARPRRLTRRPAEGKLGGVCAGLAAYFEVDVTLVRVAWIVLSIWPGAVLLGVVAYIAAWILIPVADVVDAPATATAGKQLRRSGTDRKIAGVCGGFAEYFGIDPTIVRVAWVVLTIVPCAIVFGVIAYLVAWLVVPSAPTGALHTSPSMT
jgi:phage shock protein C